MDRFEEFVVDPVFCLVKFYPPFSGSDLKDQPDLPAVFGTGYRTAFGNIAFGIEGQNLRLTADGLRIAGFSVFGFQKLPVNRDFTRTSGFQRQKLFPFNPAEKIAGKKSQTVGANGQRRAPYKDADNEQDHQDFQNGKAIAGRIALNKRLTGMRMPVFPMILGDMERVACTSGSRSGFRSWTAAFS